MAYFLAKTDPETYSIDDLERDRRTVWDGVKNPQALKAIQAMRPGDKVFLYASGGQSRVVGLATVAAQPRPDPKNAKLTVVDLEFTCRLANGPALAEIKACGLFPQWALVRQPRLSTMTAPAEFVEWIKARDPRAKI